MTLDDDVIEDIWRTAEDQNITIEKITYSGVIDSPEYNVRFKMETDDVGFIKSTFKQHNISMRDWHTTEDGEIAVVVDPT